MELDLRSQTNAQKEKPFKSLLLIAWLFTLCNIQRVLQVSFAISVLSSVFLLMFYDLSECTDKLRCVFYQMHLQ